MGTAAKFSTLLYPFVWVSWFWWICLFCVCPTCKLQATEDLLTGARDSRWLATKSREWFPHWPYIPWFLKRKGMIKQFQNLHFSSFFLYDFLLMFRMIWSAKLSESRREWLLPSSLWRNEHGCFSKICDQRTVRNLHSILQIQKVT